MGYCVTERVSIPYCRAEGGTVLQDGCPYLIVGRLLVEPDAVLVVRVVAGSATLKLQHKPSSSVWWPFVPLRTTEAQLRSILINKQQRTRKTYSKEDRSHLPHKQHTPGFRQTSLHRGRNCITNTNTEERKETEKKKTVIENQAEEAICRRSGTYPREGGDSSVVRAPDS